MNIFSSILLVTLVTLLGCTGKNDVAKKDDTLPIDSPIKFKFDPSLVGTENIAKIGDDPIAMSQLLSPSPALQELVDKNQSLMLVTAYQMASQLASQKQNPQEVVEMKSAFAEPKKNFDDFLKRMHINKVKNIKVEFGAEIAGGPMQVADKVLTESEMSRANFDLAKNKERFVRESLKSLEGIVSRRLVLQEAKKTPDQTAEDFIQKNIIGGAIAVTDEQAREYGLKNNLSEAELTPEMLIRLKDIVISRTREQKITDYVAKNLLKGPVSVGFDKPQIIVENLELSDAVPFQGKGKVNLTIFSNLMCDECKDIEAKMDNLIKTESDNFRLNYLFQFTERDREARMLAEASLCVKKQSDKGFWDFLSARRQGKLTSDENSINDTVKGLSLNFEEFQKCFLAREFQNSIDSQLSKSKELGFYRPPVVMVENQVFDNPDFNEIKASVDRIKAERGLSSSQSLWEKIKSFFFGK